MPILRATSSDGLGFSLSKWQIAIALGTVAGISVGGYVYWRYKRSPTSSGGAALKPPLNSNSCGSSSNGTVTTDSTVVAEPSPLQLVLQLKNTGNDHFKSGNYNGAIDYYNRAIDACPPAATTELATCYQNRAACHENLQNWPAVIEDCSRAIELNGKYEKALMRRARAEEMTEDWENCLDDVTCVCLLQRFGNHAALTLADRALQNLGRKHAAEAMRNRQHLMPSKHFIHTYFMSFSEDVAHKRLMEVATVAPVASYAQVVDGETPSSEVNSTSGFQKAAFAYMNDQFDDIISNCTNELSSNGRASQYYYESLSIRAAFYFLCGRFTDALDDLTAIISAEDADETIKVNSLIKRACIYMQTTKSAECFEDFDQAVQLNANISDIYHHRGQVKLLMDRPEEALADFEKAVELNPNFSLAIIQKSYSQYRYASQSDKADLLTETLANFKSCLEKFPDNIEAYTLYAQVLNEREEFEEAEKLFEKAIQVDGQNAAIYVHLGLLYLQWKGDVELAISLMKKAIKIDWKCELAYETLGSVEIHRGNLNVAIEYFKKAIELARSEMEMAHLFSLRDSAITQLKVTSRLGIDLSTMMKNRI